MRIQKALGFVCAILLINVQVVSASTILGKVAAYPTQSSSNIHPLVAGNKMSLDYRALVRLRGATLIANAGTKFEAMEEEGRIVLAISRGVLYFKVQPEKTLMTFRTPQCEVSSPTIVRTSGYTTMGKLTVDDESTTVEIAEGEMRVLSAKGLASLGSGQRIVLAQASLEEGAPAPPENLEELINETGNAESLLSPEGRVDVKANVYDAVVVDDNLEPIEEAQLSEGTEVIVKGMRDTTLLVQPVDRSLIAAWLPAEGEGPNLAAFMTSFFFFGGATAGGIVGASQANDGPASPEGEQQ